MHCTAVLMRLLTIFDFLLKTLWQKYAVMLSDISMIQYHYLSKQNEGCFNVVCIYEWVNAMKGTLSLFCDYVNMLLRPIERKEVFTFKVSLIKTRQSRSRILPLRISLAI